MTVVLGLDAAWTISGPTGICVVSGAPGDWKLLVVANSYAQFYGDAPQGETGFDAHLVLSSAERLAGERVTLIAADIPLALSPITRRREADNAISRLYGARHASTHTPSATRPGALADRMRSEFLAEGYPLRTTAPSNSGLIEVYPHPALIELTNAPRRLPYKIGKVAKYWPLQTAAERRASLLLEWAHIIQSLDARIKGVAELLPLPSAGAKSSALKSYEDTLDAVVCAWIGTCVIEGQAVAMGNEDAAIWVPLPV